MLYFQRCTCYRALREVSQWGNARTQHADQPWAPQNTQHCQQHVGVSVRCEGRGGREKGEGKGARQQLTPRCVCHSACLHGDTLACPASACHLFRCNTTTVFPTETPPLQTFFLLLEKNQKQTEKWKHQNESIHREKKEKKKKIQLTFPSSSSAFRSNERCSWTVLLEEP